MSDVLSAAEISRYCAESIAKREHFALTFAEAAIEHSVDADLMWPATFQRHEYRDRLERGYKVGWDEGLEGIAKLIQRGAARGLSAERVFQIIRALTEDAAARNARAERGGVPSRTVAPLSWTPTNGTKEGFLLDETRLSRGDRHALADASVIVVEACLDALLWRRLPEERERHWSDLIIHHWLPEEFADLYSEMLLKTLAVVAVAYTVRLGEGGDPAPRCPAEVLVMRATTGLAANTVESSLGIDEDVDLGYPEASAARILAWADVISQRPGPLETRDEVVRLFKPFETANSHPFLADFEFLPGDEEQQPQS